MTLYEPALAYLFTEQPGTLPIDLLDGEPDQQGIGFFTRFGYTDKDTSPIEWAVSGGLGYYYQSIQRILLFSRLGTGDSAQGFKGFYTFALTPAWRITVDLQIVDPAAVRVPTATMFGLRASFDF